LVAVWFETVTLCWQISEGIQSIELNGLRLASRCPMQIAAFDIEAHHFGNAPRHDDPAAPIAGSLALRP
jgi:hypothetical protein